MSRQLEQTMTERRLGALATTRRQWVPRRLEQTTAKQRRLLVATGRRPVPRQCSLPWAATTVDALATARRRPMPRQCVLPWAATRRQWVPRRLEQASTVERRLLVATGRRPVPRQCSLPWAASANCDERGWRVSCTWGREKCMRVDVMCAMREGLCVILCGWGLMHGCASGDRARLVCASIGVKAISGAT